MLPGIYPFNISDTRIFDELEEHLTDFYKKDTSYPPYNVYNSEQDRTTIELAVTGFPRENLNAYIDNQGYLVVEGSTNKEENQNRKYIHRGLAQRYFKKTFMIDNLEVKNIEVKNGIMYIDLEKNAQDTKKLEIN